MFYMEMTKKDNYDYKNNDNNIPGDDGEVERAVSEVGQLWLHRHYLCLDQVGNILWNANTVIHYIQIQIQFFDQVGDILWNTNTIMH